MTLERQMFYKMLNIGRVLKSLEWDRLSREHFFLGMLFDYATHLLDLKIAESQRNCWMDKADGAD